MPFTNAIRVLPELPVDTPSLENLIREFEKGLGERSSTSGECPRNVVASPTSSSGRIVKRIVEAYELRAIENAQQKQDERRSAGLVNTLGNAGNKRTSVIKGFGGSAPAICYKTVNGSQQPRQRLEVFSSACDIDTKKPEMHLVTNNRYHSNTKVEKAAKVWPRLSSFNHVAVGPHTDPQNELMTIQPNSLRKSEMWCLNEQDRLYWSPSRHERDDKFAIGNKCRANSRLDNNGERDCEDVLHILRDSSSSSSNSSYKNLRINLYEGDEWQGESSSSISTPRRRFSSLLDDTSNTDDRSPMNISFQSPFKDRGTTCNANNGPNGLSDLRNVEPVTRLSTSRDRDNRKPRVIGAFLKLPIKINNTNITWIPALNAKLPRKNSLKKLMSMFGNKRKKISAKHSKHSRKQQRVIHDLESERCSSSSSSQQSWYSESDINGLSSPTFETFGRTNSPDLYRVDQTKKTRIVLTELSREDLATHLGSWGNISSVEPAYSSDQAKPSWNIDPASKGATVASCPGSKMSREHLSLPKHPYLSQKKLAKHPFVAHTKIDWMDEETTTTTTTTTTTMTTTMKQESTKVKEKFDTPDLESSIASCASSSISASLNISTSRVSEWIASSPNNIYDVPKRYNNCNDIIAERLFLCGII